MKANGGAKIVNGVVDLTSLNGELTVRNAALDGRSYGNLTITAATRLPLLTLVATATLDDVQIHGTRRVAHGRRLSRPGAHSHPSYLVRHAARSSPGKHVRKDLPFDGFIEGDAIVSGPLNQPSSMKADVTLSTVQLNASPNARPVVGRPCARPGFAQCAAVAYGRHYQFHRFRACQLYRQRYHSRRHRPPAAELKESLGCGHPRPNQFFHSSALQPGSARRGRFHRQRLRAWTLHRAASAKGDSNCRTLPYSCAMFPTAWTTLTV